MPLAGKPATDSTPGPQKRAGDQKSNGDHVRLYYHMDYLGTADYLTSPVSGKVEAWTHYNEWGLIVHNAVLKCGQRELDLVKRYATHDYDSVLELYYAKARFYDAHDRRFTAVDSILDPSQYDLREYIREPVQLIQMLYVKDNAINWIDRDGLRVWGVSAPTISADFGAGASAVAYRLWDDKGNEIAIVSGYLGGAIPNIGADFTGGIYSNATNVFELVNSDAIAAGLAIGFVSGEVQFGKETSGRSFYVLSASLGISALPVDLHAGMGYTKIVNIFKHNRTVLPKNFDMSYFSDLNCTLQEKISKDLLLPMS